VLKRLSYRVVRRSTFVRLCSSLPFSLQAKIFKPLLKADRSWILLLSSRLKKAILSNWSFDGRSDSSKCLVIGFLSDEAGGWILEYLFRDLSSFARSTNFILAKNYADLCFHYFSFNSSAVVFSLHPSFVEQILSLGIPSRNIISFYTHSRLGMGVSSLKDLGALLPMNSTEAVHLALSGINPSIIRVFPAGYDPALFSIDSHNKSTWNERSVDVLFVCRYASEDNEHNYRRKAYPLIISLCKVLARKGYNVVVLGRGWQEFGDDEFKRVVQINEPRHDEYPGIYRSAKLLVIPSRQEGGPVSWLEAMACGCLTLSTCSGFPAELRSGQMGSYLMPLRATVQDWISEIERILLSADDSCIPDMAERLRFLEPAAFPSLAYVLESIACNSCLTDPSLHWPSSHPQIISSLPHALS
jgi:glycosyltransferase involved in cell wall biosynthesis